MSTTSGKGSSGKKIGLWAGVSIGVGGMIGAGIFSVIGVAAEISGNALPLSFLLGGIIALLTTYSFARLSSTYPSAGGPVEFLFKGLGSSVFSRGLNVLLWLGYIFALALYARAFGGYAETFFSDLSIPYLKNILITLVILFFTSLNAIGARAVGRSEVLIVLIKVFILIFFIIAGMVFMDPSRITPTEWPGGLGILHGIVIVFIAYEGFGLVTNAGGDMKDPKKTLPKALFLSVLITMIIYVAVSTVVIGNLSVSEIVEAKDHALARAASPFLGQSGFVIITVAALFSIASAINATLYGAANVSYMIARKGALPGRFNRKIWQESKEGLYITAGLVLIIANLIHLGEIAMAGSAIFLLIYGMVNLSHLRLYKKTGARKWLIWTAMLACFISLGVLIIQSLKDNLLMIAVTTVVVGLAFVIEYFYSKYFSSERTRKKSGN